MPPKIHERPAVPKGKGKQYISPRIAAQAATGFPEKIQAVFGEVCETEKTIILSRVPGKATFGLIEEEYAQKGYHIKAKSCDWGPMEGFVCKQPIFNKKGLGNLRSNLDAHVKYYEEMREVLGDNVKFKERENILFPRGAPDIKNLNLFTPIIISKNRKEEVLRHPTVNQLKDQSTEDLIFLTGSTRKSPDESYKDGTVVSVFCLKKLEINEGEAELWEVLHGPIWVLKDGTWVEYRGVGSFEVLLGGEITTSQNPDINRWKQETASLGPRTSTKVDVDVEFIIDDKLKIKTDTFFPVYGVRNPEHLNQSIKDNHKHAVTGDYDLFSIWPLKTSNVTLSELERLAEKKYRKSNSTALISPFSLLIHRETKYRRPNFKIDFIPHYEDIKPLESEDLGNYTPIGYNLLKIINQTAKNWGADVEIVKHSDEGGRPGIDEIDLPLAVFHPDGVMDPTGRPKDGKAARQGLMMKIDNILEFIDYLYDLFKELEINPNFAPDTLSFNHAWVTHMLALTLYDINTQPVDLTDSITPGKIQKFFKNINDKFEKSYKEFEDLRLKLLKEELLKKKPLEKNPPLEKKPLKAYRLELFLKVVKVVFGFQPNTADGETDEAFKKRINPFLDKFTQALLSYTLDHSMKAMAGLNSVRATMNSKEYNKVLLITPVQHE